MWYDKKGVLVTSPYEIEKKLSDPSYKIIKQETLPNGKWVSTVWLALDHRMGREGDGRPVIFETMVFPSRGDYSELDCARYCTEEEAAKGHEEMVKKYK
jgi:hypothetical protein